MAKLSWLACLALLWAAGRGAVAEGGSNSDSDLSDHDAECAARVLSTIVDRCDGGGPLLADQRAELRMVAWGQAISTMAECHERVDLQPAVARGIYVYAPPEAHDFVAAAAARFHNVTGLNVALTAVSQDTCTANWHRFAAGLQQAPGDPEAYDFWMVTGEAFGLVEAPAAFQDISVLRFDYQAVSGDMPAAWRLAMVTRMGALQWVTPMHLLYRRDVFAARNITLPATWDDLVAILTQHGNRDLDGDGVEEAGLCFDAAPACGLQVSFMTIVASIVQLRGPADGALFDPSSPELLPLARGPVLREALRVWKALLPYNLPPAVVNASGACDAHTTSWVAGRCLMSWAPPLAFKMAGHASTGSKIRGAQGVAPLPGSPYVLDRSTVRAGAAGPGRLVKCTAELCPNAVVALSQSSGATELVNTVVPLSTRGIAINARAAQSAQAAAFAMASSSLSQDNRRRLQLGITELAPSQESDLEAADWVAAGYERSDVAAFVSAYRQILANDNAMLQLRMPGTLAIGSLIKQLVHSVASNGLDVDTAETAFLMGVRQVVDASGGAAALLPPLRASLGAVASDTPTGTNETPQRSDVKGGGSSRALILGVCLPVAAVIAIIVCVLAVYMHRATLHRQLRAECARAPGVGRRSTLAVTDIENSTSLWEDLEAAVMDKALKLHHRCIREMLVRHNGYESATEGDSFIIAFFCPEDAVKFAFDVQIGLLSLPWPKRLMESQHAPTVYVRPSRSKCEHALGMSRGQTLRRLFLAHEDLNQEAPFRLGTCHEGVLLGVAGAVASSLCFREPRAGAAPRSHATPTRMRLEGTALQPRPLPSRLSLADPKSYTTSLQVDSWLLSMAGGESASGLPAIHSEENSSNGPGAHLPGRACNFAAHSSSGLAGDRTRAPCEATIGAGSGGDGTGSATHTHTALQPPPPAARSPPSFVQYQARSLSLTDRGSGSRLSPTDERGTQASRSRGSGGGTSQREGPTSALGSGQLPVGDGSEVEGDDATMFREAHLSRRMSRLRSASSAFQAPGQLAAYRASLAFSEDPPPGASGTEPAPVTLVSMLRDAFPELPCRPGMHGSSGGAHFPLFRGLRVRIGFAAGVQSAVEYGFNRASSRTVYSGRCLQLAKAVSDAGRGGQVTLPAPALALLDQRLIDSLESGCTVLYSGRHVLKPGGEDVDMYTAYPRKLLARAAYTEALRSHAEKVPGVLSALLGTLAVAVAHLEDPTDFAHWGLEVSLAGNTKVRQAAQELATAHSGYLLLTRPGALQAVFISPRDAALWLLELQALLESGLAHDGGNGSTLSPSPRELDGHALFGRASESCASSLRLQRGGVDVGLLASYMMPGRYESMQYDGRAAKRATCLAAHADRGEVLVSFEGVRAILGEESAEFTGLLLTAGLLEEGVAGPNGGAFALPTTRALESMGVLRSPTHTGPFAATSQPSYSPAARTALAGVAAASIKRLQRRLSQHLRPHPEHPTGGSDSPSAEASTGSGWALPHSPRGGSGVLTLTGGSPPSLLQPAGSAVLRPSECGSTDTTNTIGVAVAAAAAALAAFDVTDGGSEDLRESTTASTRHQLRQSPSWLHRSTRTRSGSLRPPAPLDLSVLSPGAGRLGSHVSRDGTSSPHTSEGPPTPSRPGGSSLQDSVQRQRLVEERLKQLKHALRTPSRLGTGALTAELGNPPLQLPSAYSPLAAPAGVGAVGGVIHTRDQALSPLQTSRLDQYLVRETLCLADDSMPALPGLRAAAASPSPATPGDAPNKPEPLSPAGHQQQPRQQHDPQPQQQEQPVPSRQRSTSSTLPGPWGAVRAPSVLSANCEGGRWHAVGTPTERSVGLRFAAEARTIKYKGGFFKAWVVKRVLE